MSSGLTTGIIAVALASGKVNINVQPMTRKQKKALKRRRREFIDMFIDMMKIGKPFSIEEYKKSMSPEEYAKYNDEGLLTRHFLGDD